MVGVVLRTFLGRCGRRVAGEGRRISLGGT